MSATASDASAPLLTDIDEVLSTTRAVRRRLDLDRPVPRAVLERCIELARQAPMAENREVARFVVIEDPGVRAQVAGVYRRAIEDHVTTPLRISAERRAAAGRPPREVRPEMARAMVSAQHLVDHFHEVPAQILVGSVDRVPQEPRGPFASMFYGSVYPALWSLQLALRSRGLGSALTCIHLHYEREVAQILDLPEQFTQVALLPVAYTRGLDFKVARRAPAEQVVTWR
ncbi:MAG TPA: nitroreductase family protein [Conexibacter sp.]|nr:nitroreductase family protein [Conexibacter sp.]